MDSDDEDVLLSPTDSASSFDDEDVNIRMAPNWCAYRHILQAQGFRLDTCRDVKQWYQEYWESLSSQGHIVTRNLPGYVRACSVADDSELCKDAGLPDNLFRGTSCSTSQKVVIKAVHILSREYDAIRYLSTAPIRNHTMNHTIPILALIEVPGDNVVFIVMEEWIPLQACDMANNSRLFLNFLRQCIEHIAFMHAHHMAYFDLHPRNILTDNRLHAAFIDFETCRRFGEAENLRVYGIRGTNLPPELEQGGWGDPYKVDVWALAVFIQHMCTTIGYHVPELTALTRRMLHSDFEQRPTARHILAAFNSIVSKACKETKLVYNAPAFCSAVL